MNFLKRGWSWVVGAFGILLGLLYWNRTKRIAAETKVALNETDKADHVLETKKEAIKEAIAKDEDLVKDLKKKQKDLDVDSLSPNDIEAFWDKYLNR